MRKMYFAMIPKRSLLEEAAIVAGVVAGVYYGAKALLGEEKVRSLLTQAKDLVIGGRDKALGAAQGGENPEEPDMGAAEEASIVERLRRAYQKEQ